MEERRRDHLDFSDLKSDVKILLSNQVEIKDQVKKTNGRVTVLEKLMYTFIGGSAVFIYLDKVLHIIK